MPTETYEPIRVLLAGMRDRQRRLVERSLRRANFGGRDAGAAPAFALQAAEGRGLAVVQQACAADVVLFGLDDEELPGEASHVLAEHPRVKVVGVDQDGRARVVLGGVAGTLGRDLPAVIRWITRRA